MTEEAEETEAEDLLAQAAEEVYAVPPADFVATRKAWVARVRAAGHREAAKEVAALRKPSLAAHAMNAAVRRGDPAVAELLKVGERLRHAQATLDVAAMTELRGDRDAALEGWVRAAAGEGTLTAAVADEVRSTGVAALADAAAAEAATSGTLTRALGYSGFGEVDLADAVARTSTGVVLRRVEGGAGTTPAPTESGAGTTPAPTESTGGTEDDPTEDVGGTTPAPTKSTGGTEHDDTERTAGPSADEIRALRTELAEAEDEVTAARAARKEAAAALTSTASALAVAEAGVEQARRLLAQAEKHLARAEKAQAEAEEVAASADADLDAARERRDTARAALEEAEDA